MEGYRIVSLYTFYIKKKKKKDTFCVWQKEKNAKGKKQKLRNILTKQ
jgi:hypothetical protein